MEARSDVRQPLKLLPLPRLTMTSLVMEAATVMQSPRRMACLGGQLPNQTTRSSRVRRTFRNNCTRSPDRLLRARHDSPYAPVSWGYEGTKTPRPGIWPSIRSCIASFT